MGNLKTIYTDVQVDVDLSEWDDEELLEELKLRGVDIDVEELTDEELLKELRARNVKTTTPDPNLLLAIDWYIRGNIKETLHYLEMTFPELNGLTEKVKNAFS